MLDVSVIVHSPGRSTEAAVKKDRVSLGSGELADIRIEDRGLASLHSSINIAGDRVWILSEDPSKATYVNGKRVPAVGTPLTNGDKIEFGDSTIAWVRINALTGSFGGRRSARPPGWLRALIIGLPMVLIAGTAILLLRSGGGSRPLRELDPISSKNATAAGRNGAVRPDEPSGSAEGNANISSDQPRADVLPQTSPLRLYGRMTRDEQMKFVAQEAQRIASKMGNRPCDFTPGALQRIKQFVDGYASRIGKGESGRGFHEDLRVVFDRATRFAPLVIRWFTRYGVYPEVGLYMAMIESEYHECLTSPAGAEGMFQFMAATALEYQVQPGERCDETKLAPAAARYFKDLIGYFGTDATSVALAVASYNRGQGNIMGDLHKVVEDGGERSFWTLVENPEKLHVKFQTENINYVPKFFAAAILGENPREFGLNIRPLSTYATEAP